MMAKQKHYYVLDNDTYLFYNPDDRVWYFVKYNFYNNIIITSIYYRSRKEAMAAYENNLIIWKPKL